jgi:prolyl-tRNA editing enzyme YbaK/EbsC (Cys-tRNA(Pro) deacylase)
MSTTTENEARGIDLVHRYLEERGVAHEVVDHEKTFSATQEAKASGIPPDHAAKTMVLRQGEDYHLAVIPGSRRLDLRKARSALEATSHLRLASEAEMEVDFPAFDVGAVPPLGPMLPAPEALDMRLMDHERILCSGGDHRHSVLVDPRDLVRTADARVADICED